MTRRRFVLAVPLLALCVSARPCGLGASTSGTLPAHLTDQVCANVASLPLDDTSTFIRAGHGGRVSRGTALTAELGVMAADVEGCGLR